MKWLLPALTMIALAPGASFAFPIPFPGLGHTNRYPFERAPFNYPHNQYETAARDRAETACINQAEDQGLQVLNVLDRNRYNGGTEVFLRVSRRDDRYTIGCNYANNSGEVELYRINDDGGDRYYDNDRDESYYDDSTVRDRQDAERIARDEVGSQLGIDNPYSRVVQIQDIRRESNDRIWLVKGNANGAAFEVRIRTEDGSIQDFQLY